jgi:hypothetical protein
MSSARLRTAPLLFGVAICLTRAMALGAQAVLLQIRPRVGDTLHLILDQETELTGTRRLGTGESVTTVTTAMHVFSRAIVERSGPSATYVRAVTDSVRLTSNDTRAREIEEAARESLEGRAMTLRISPDGTVSLADSSAASVSRDVADAVALMPAAFPRGPVAVGYSWSRDMPLPGNGRVAPGGGNASAWLHTKFRLDSLSRHGTIAYISMRGEMSPDPDAANGEGSGPILQNGSVSGTMLVDRTRGWLTESQFTIVAHSTVHVPGTDNTVMRFETRVNQRMKTVEKRQ